MQLYGAYVAYEVRLPDVVAGALPKFARAIEVIRLTGEPVVKDERVIEDELVVVEQVHHCRRVRHHGQTRRSKTATIEEPVMRVQRYREQAAGTPFEGLLVVFG